MIERFNRRASALVCNQTQTSVQLGYKYIVAFTNMCMYQVCCSLGFGSLVVSISVLFNVMLCTVDLGVVSSFSPCV